jgi:hypothetical protein
MQLGKCQVFDEASCDDLGLRESNRAIAHRVALLQAYFARIGLRKPASEAAAHRVVSEVGRTVVDWNDPDVDRRLVVVAREWIRSFSENYVFAVAPSQPVDCPVSNWYSRAPALLAKILIYVPRDASAELVALSARMSRIPGGLALTVRRAFQNPLLRNPRRVHGSTRLWGAERIERLDEWRAVRRGGFKKRVGSASRCTRAIEHPVHIQ